MEMPAIGSWVEVTTDYSHANRTLAWTINSVHTKVGKVVPKGDWEDDDVFCIMTDDRKMPVRSIKMSYVKSIKNLDTNAELDTTVARNEAKAAEVINFDIVGSKGNVYVVQKNGFSWSCNCPAGSNKKGCKHLVEAKAKYEATAA